VSGLERYEHVMVCPVRGRAWVFVDYGGVAEGEVRRLVGPRCAEHIVEDVRRWRGYVRGYVRGEAAERADGGGDRGAVKRLDNGAATTKSLETPVKGGRFSPQRFPPPPHKLSGTPKPLRKLLQRKGPGVAGANGPV
jgi:hypothetical protein